MDCMVFDTNVYKGENLHMGKGKEKKPKDDIKPKIVLNTQERAVSNNEKVSGNGRLKKVVEISMGGVITIVVTVAASAIAASWIISSNIGDLKSDIRVAQNDISSMKTDISDLKTDVSSLKKDVNNINI